MFTRISTVPAHTDDASFRAWGKAISDSLEAIGVTKTADSGQIDWSTVLKPSATNTMMGYEIRQFTDALQASCPVFIKISYGSGSYAITKPGMIVYVGRATDGAGNLTGETAGPFYMNCSGSTETSYYTSYFSSDGGRLNIGLWVNCPNSSSNVFWIERMKDDNGEPTANGIHIVSSTNTTNHSMVSSCQYLPPTSGVAYPATPGKATCCIPVTSNMSTYNENIGLFPIHPNLGYAANPDLGGFAITLNELDSAGTIMTINIMGANHNYIIVKGLSTTCGGNQTCNMMVRCE